ncbi:ABC transporter permease [Iamia majanohamensis]|uniref:ABC transporter permease n=1 Tax=Iamia majanohamensis TaxID=467976 RepID=A0AAF0BQP5_9ACTN|nr:ABC transporter permease [Iamia majanohamensis]WCO65061.1 ABC transporter permease [Iamia majanohamensis]
MSPRSLNLVKLVARKLAQLVAVLFVVTLFTFLLVRLLPGDPVDLLVPVATDTANPEEQAIIEERRAQITEDLGLDEPLPQQYATWLGGFVTGDLGNEYTVSSTIPVSDSVTSALPPTIQLILYSQIISLTFALPVGVISAYRQGGIFDRFANLGAFGSLSMPNFAIGLLLAYWVGVRLNPSLPAWMNIPPQGYTPFPGWNPADWSWEPNTPNSVPDHFFGMLLPALSLAFGQFAVYMRLLRSDMLQTLQEDFILMAKSKGISDRRVLWRHALRPSSLTLITVAGLSVGTLIGGAVVIEVIFSIPGMGSLIASSIIGREFITVQSCVAIVAIAFVLINALLDILYSILDPRIRNVRAS